MKKTVFLLCILTACLVGCTVKPSSPYDPYEGFNRAMYSINTGIDEAILRPVAKVYNVITPPPLQKGFVNAFNNIDEVNTIANDLLQFKIAWALNDFWRLVINSTIGIGGLFDVATRMGLPYHYEDLGLTFAYYSEGQKSPYLVLPILGPGTFRSMFNYPMAAATNPFEYVDPRAIKYSLVGLRIVNLRSQLLPYDKTIRKHAFDRYAFVRHAYLTKRYQRVTDNQIYKTPAEYIRAQKAAPYHDKDDLAYDFGNTDQERETTSKGH